MNVPIPNPAGPHQPPILDLADIPIPNLDELITEDGAPVDSIFTERQYRLLTDPLYSSWPGPGEGRSFLALTNVAFFPVNKQPPLVPDCLLSLDVDISEDVRAKENRSYFLWIMGKPPDVVIEIVSDKRGGEEDFKQSAYARHGVTFYVIFDPQDLLQGGALRAWALQRGRYVAVEPHWFPEVGLGLTLWTGTFERMQSTWLRWCDQQGRVIPTGAERAERLAAQLRALGHNPEI